jgi:diguanylate cyclase (GGDEF)-like protein
VQTTVFAGIESENPVELESETFEGFSARLLNAIAANIPATDILRLVAHRLQVRLHAPLVTIAVGQSTSLETVEAEGVPPRAWGVLDRHLRALHGAADSPLAVPEALASFLEAKTSHRPKWIWELPVYTPEKTRTGAFFVFLSPADDHSFASPLVNPNLRASLERKCLLAGIVLDRQRLQEEVSRQLHFDPLTGLPNRREFEHHMVEAIRASLTGGAANFSMMLLNLTRFHRINEMLGYDLADRILREVAERLFGAGRGNGRGVFARVAGDEFALLLPGITDSSALLGYAHELLDSLLQPFQAQGVRLQIGACIGIARFPADGQTVRRLFNSCEIALADSRRTRGGPHISFFHPGLVRQTIEGEDVESYIADALKHRRFELHYQPVFAAHGCMSGFEGLVRLRTRDGALVHPGAFLPAAEESGLVLHLGQWVLESACAQIREWCDSPTGPVRVGINVSSRQLSHHSFVQDVADTIRDHSVDPRLIEIELTESALVSDMDTSRSRLDQLRDLGLGVAIDDFGTGYSSLSYLHEFRMDKVKIDQSFVRRILTDHAALPVVDAIIRVASSLGATVVAEGVEDARQYHVLAEHGCRELQGYLFSRPLSTPAATQFALGPGRQSASRFAGGQPAVETGSGSPAAGS